MEKLKIGMYAFIKNYYPNAGIGKIINIHSNGFYEPLVEIQYDDCKVSPAYSHVVASFNKKEIEQKYILEYEKEVLKNDK